MGRANQKIRGLNLAPYVQASMQANAMILEAGKIKGARRERNAARFGNLVVDGVKTYFGMQQADKNREQQRKQWEASHGLAQDRFQFSKQQTVLADIDRQLAEAQSMFDSEQAGAQLGIAGDPNKMARLQNEINTLQGHRTKLSEAMRTTVTGRGKEHAAKVVEGTEAIPSPEGGQPTIYVAPGKTGMPAAHTKTPKGEAVTPADVGDPTLRVTTLTGQIAQTREWIASQKGRGAMAARTRGLARLKDLEAKLKTATGELREQEASKEVDGLIDSLQTQLVSTIPEVIANDKAGMKEMGDAWRAILRPQLMQAAMSGKQLTSGEITTIYERARATITTQMMQDPRYREHAGAMVGTQKLAEEGVTNSAGAIKDRLTNRAVGELAAKMPLDALASSRAGREETVRQGIEDRRSDAAQDPDRQKRGKLEAAQTGERQAISLTTRNRAMRAAGERPPGDPVPKQPTPEKTSKEDPRESVDAVARNLGVPKGTSLEAFIKMRTAEGDAESVSPEDLAQEIAGSSNRELIEGALRDKTLGTQAKAILRDAVDLMAVESGETPREPGNIAERNLRAMVPNSGEADQNFYVDALKGLRERTKKGRIGREEALSILDEAAKVHFGTMASQRGAGLNILKSIAQANNLDLSASIQKMMKKGE